MQICVLDVLAFTFKCLFFLCPDVDAYRYHSHKNKKLKNPNKPKSYSLSQWAQEGKRRATNMWKEDFWQELAFRNDLALFYNILFKICSCGVTAQGSTVGSEIFSFNFSSKRSKFCKGKQHVLTHLTSLSLHTITVTKRVYCFKWNIGVLKY